MDTAPKRDLVSTQDTGTQSASWNSDTNRNEPASNTQTMMQHPSSSNIILVDSDDDMPPSMRALDLANDRSAPNSNAIVRRIQRVQITNGNHEHSTGINKLREENERLKKQIADLNEQIANLTQTSDNARSEINRLKYKIEEDRFVTEARIDQLRRKHQTDFKETQRRTEQLEDENQTLNNELSQLRRENEKLKLQVEQLKKDKITLESEVGKLKAQLDILQQSGNEMKKELDETKRDLDTMKRQMEEDREKNKTEERSNISKLLLGEVAFQFDRVAIGDIFRDRFKPSNPNCKKWTSRARSLTIAQVLNNRIKSMTTEENDRLEHFLEYLQQCGWDDGYHFVDVLSELKYGRLHLAHLTSNYKNDQDRTKLKKAAEFADNKDQILEYQDVIDALCDYTHTEYPLHDEL
ncbi:unnamed protein product [Rotaria socialis]|uniref:Uncharacterized protein n=1 Tax=Rotaria socialis TaxID=392032 RepID=A0A817Q2Z1_9BILA|nr:unnamed protein product [Rotaria socialis]CAF3377452.1 unnamed protein product [Rotaria socialis]CAF4419696.1 unnamed protein product [Rotaria socialis]CAF4506955.1 unnamed protein product [Rotaria socialis]